MSYTPTKSKYHVALNGQGLILTGAPDRLAYQQKQSGVFESRFAQGDRSYTDFSDWWIWAQSDWSGGNKEEGDWADDAKYLEATNVNTFKSGQIQVANDATAQTTSLTNTDYISKAIFGGVGTSAATESAFYLGTKATSTAGAEGAAVWKSTDGGDNWTKIVEIAGAASVRDLFFSVDGSNNRILVIITNTKVYTWDGTTATDVTTNAGTVYFSCGTDYASGIYFIDQGALNNAPRLKKTLDGFATAATNVVTMPAGTNVLDMTAFNGSIYYLRINDVNLTTGCELRKWDGTNDTFIYSFVGRVPISAQNTTKCNRSLKTIGSNLYIFFTDGTIWKNTTSDVLSLIYNDFQSYYKAGTDAIVDGNKIRMANLILEDDAGTIRFHNGLVITGHVEKDTPVATSGSVILYTKLITSNEAKIYRSSSSIYSQVTASIISNEFSNVPTVEKYFRSCTVIFSALVSGDQFEVFYKKESGGYVSLGTISFANDGGTITSKTLFFPASVTAKKLTYKIEISIAGTSTPTIKDVVFQYIPLPIYKKSWDINVNCGDEVKRLDGGLVETVGRELAAKLEIMWWTKTPFDWQDLDYATTLLNGALSSSATTITVDDTYDFPEQGRLKVDDEEMFYTGKTPTTFTGVTRGARDTAAVAHLDNAVINNAYKVIVTNLQKRIPILLNDKELEYTIGLSLREV